jgi:hypothetical protein
MNSKMNHLRIYPTGVRRKILYSVGFTVNKAYNNTISLPFIQNSTCSLIENGWITSSMITKPKLII